MRTPSNRSGVPTLLVVAVPALILFLGFVLAPGAFEFRAWPEPSRPGAVDEIVEAPAERAVEVPVARVKTRRGGPLSVRGESPRRSGPRAEGRANARGSESRRGSRRSSAREQRDGGSRDGGNVVEGPVLVVEETPAPVTPAPEQPAQLVEVPSTEQVARPDAAPLLPEHTPAPLEDYDHERDGDHGDRGDYEDDFGDDDRGDRDDDYGDGRRGRRGRERGLVAWLLGGH